MHRLLLLSLLLLLASCISFPRAETRRREGNTLTPEFNPWKRNPGTPEAETASPEGTTTPDGTAPPAEEAPPMKSRKNFNDPYFRQS